MKKIALSMVLGTSLLFSSESILGEFGSVVENVEDKSSLTVNVGIWQMNWEQTSTASEMLKNKNDALDVSYEIDSTLSTVASIIFSEGDLNGRVDYVGSSKDSGSNSLSMNLSAMNMIPYLSFEVRSVNSDFNGKFNAKDGDGKYAKSDFTSEVDIFDFIVYPMNDYLGLGYRTTSYEFPQDVYIIHDTSGDLLANGKGAVDMEYEGSFWTAVIDNQKLVDSRNNYNGLVYSAIGGIGKLTPSSFGFDDYLGDSDAMFVDAQLGYSYQTKDSDGFGYGVSIGYRYNKISVDESGKVANPVDVDDDGTIDGKYNIVTKFDTTFHGPFIDLTISY